MADEKIIPNTFVEGGEKPKGPKVWQYVGPKPAPLISNLPIDLGQTRLGTLSTKFPADELPEKYIDYVRRTAPHTKDWWK